MIFDLRSNEERMKQLGKSVSTRSKQYRIKRIDINVKINVLAYSVEVVGGLLLGFLSLLQPATFLYIGVEIWYGNVIPSCYLLNSSDTKAFIMEQGWVIALSNLFKKSKPTLKEKDNNLAENQADEKTQATKSENASIRRHAKQSNGRRCRKKIEGNGSSSEFNKNTTPGGRTKSMPFGTLTQRSMHPTSPIVPPKNGQLGCPTHSKSSLNQVPCPTTAKYFSSRDIYEQPKPGPSKEVILHELDDIIERNTKGAVVQKYENNARHTKTSNGNQKYFYQTPSVFYIHRKGDDACDSVEFQENDITITLPNQVEYL